ncbi:MAG: glutaredoxin family protein [candidate division Zixibacteria bacterium]|nr:glutaredoxin family protein [candidate division Zixibacteria bacterium]
MSEVMIYTKVGCPYCAAARKHYSDEGIAFKEIDIHDTPGAKEKVLGMTSGQAIVPVIVDNGEVKIGFGGG